MTGSSRALSAPQPLRYTSTSNRRCFHAVCQHLRPRQLRSIGRSTAVRATTEVLPNAPTIQLRTLLLAPDGDQIIVRRPAINWQILLRALARHSNALGQSIATNRIDSEHIFIHTISQYKLTVNIYSSISLIKKYKISHILVIIFRAV